MYVYGQKEAFNTNIHGSIVQWEELGGEGGSMEGGEGGSLISRRKSSEFLRKLSLFEPRNETEYPQSIQTSNSISFSNLNLSHNSNVSERKSNEKQGREYEMDNSCGTKGIVFLFQYLIN